MATIDRITDTRLSDLIAALEALAGEENDDGYRTTQELVEATGWSEDKVRKGLGALIRAKNAVCRSTPRTYISGVTHPTPGYKLIKGPETQTPP